MYVVDSHLQSITKLEIQLGKLAIVIDRRAKRKLLSHPVQNLKS